MAFCYTVRAFYLSLQLVVVVNKKMQRDQSCNIQDTHILFVINSKVHIDKHKQLEKYRS